MAVSSFFNWWQFWKVYSLVVGKRRSLQTVHIHAVLLFVTEPSLELQMLRKRGKERLSTNRVLSLWRSARGEICHFSGSLIKLIKLISNPKAQITVTNAAGEGERKAVYKQGAVTLTQCRQHSRLDIYSKIGWIDKYYIYIFVHIYKPGAVNLTQCFSRQGTSPQYQ